MNSTFKILMTLQEYKEVLQNNIVEFNRDIENIKKENYFQITEDYRWVKNIQDMIEDKIYTLQHELGKEKQRLNLIELLIKSYEEKPFIEQI